MASATQAFLLPHLKKVRLRLAVGDAPGCLLIPASFSGCSLRFEQMPRNPQVCRMAFPPEEIETPSP